MYQSICTLWAEVSSARRRDPVAWVRRQRLQRNIPWFLFFFQYDWLINLQVGHSNVHGPNKGGLSQPRRFPNMVVAMTIKLVIENQVKCATTISNHIGRAGCERLSAEQPYLLLHAGAWVVFTVSVDDIWPVTIQIIPQYQISLTNTSP